WGQLLIQGEGDEVALQGTLSGAVVAQSHHRLLQVGALAGPDRLAVAVGAAAGRRPVAAAQQGQGDDADHGCVAAHQSQTDAAHRKPAGEVRGSVHGVKYPEGGRGAGVTSFLTEEPDIGCGVSQVGAHRAFDVQVDVGDQVAFILGGDVHWSVEVLHGQVHGLV